MIGSKSFGSTVLVHCCHWYLQPAWPTQPSQGITMSAPAPARHLESRAFSSGTLIEGLDLVDKQQIKEELIDRDIQACVTCLGGLPRFLLIYEKIWDGLLCL